jgi:DNA-binding MarR family transcriptional regulator
MARRDEDEATDDLLFSLRSSVIEMVRSKGLSDLSLRQLAVLLVSHAAEQPQTVRGLAIVLGVSKPAITRAIDRLATYALVRRLPDPADGRSVLVEVTRSGHSLCRSLEKAPKVP